MLRIIYATIALVACLLMLTSNVFTSNVALAEMKNSITLQSTTTPQTSKAKVSEAEAAKSRGQLLYENHCGGCHETSVHGRNPRKADSIGAIKHWITVWQKELKLNWSKAEIDDVTRYLNFKYYQFSE